MVLKIGAVDFGIGYFPTPDAVGPGELPRKYTATLDLLVALTAAASAW
jgi:hypothetical protein